MDKPKSRTQQALDLLLSNPEITPHGAALSLGISPAAVYRAIKARQGKTLCPCCGQVVRDGFTVKTKNKG